MAPKKKPGAAAHTSTLKALSHAAAEAVGTTGMHGNMDAAMDVAGAGGLVTTSIAAKTGAGDTEEGQGQQHSSGHAPQGAGGKIIPSLPLHPIE